MSDEQWMEILRRMQGKDPALITEDSSKILTSYHRKQESVMSALFYGQCGQCHVLAGSSEIIARPAVEDARALNALVTLASERFGGEISPPEIRDMMHFHKERQQWEMAVFSRDCAQCHPPDQPKKGIRDRQEWILLIASLQDKVYEV